MGDPVPGEVSALKKKYRKRPTGAHRVVSAVALILVVVGVGLIGYSLLGENSPVSEVVDTATRDDGPAAYSPPDTTLSLTIPKMWRVEDLPVYNAPYDDEDALAASALHDEYTGFPWQEDSNVYIAGHRMGYPGTRSFLVFYDLDKLEAGDEVFLTDANGTTYSYRVFDKYITEPFEYYRVTAPVPGKNILTLQTCTLPDYAQRFIVQAELTRVT
jgi:sortase A